MSDENKSAAIEKYRTEERAHYWWSTAVAAMVCTLLIGFYSTYWSSGYLAEFRVEERKAVATACIDAAWEKLPEVQRAFLETCFNAAGERK